MEAPEREPETSRFGFFLLPDFSMLAFTSALEPLRAANRMAGRELYSWHVISVDGLPARASSGVRVIADSGIEATEQLDNLAVVGGLNSHSYDEQRVVARLRRLARRGARIGALSTGSFVLAKAGLLDGYRCTIHWEALPAFNEAFPHLQCSAELFEIDRSRFTCSGGTAALDMMLSLIAVEHGRDLAVQVAEQFIHERIREQHDSQRMTLRSRLGISHPKLLHVIELMESNLEEPLSRAELARLTGLSTRQLERLFQKYLGRTPTRYYLELRLYRARMLLTQTAMSVLDIALACGFVSASHFSKCYREFFLKSPRDERLSPRHSKSA